MIVPTIHLNGTDRKTLLEQSRVAARAISSAIEKLEEAAPNQRDYYPQGDAAWKQAREDHASRVRRLMEVHKELADIVKAISRA